MKHFVRKVTRRLRPNRTAKTKDAIDFQDQQIIDRVSPYTMTGPLRIEALLKSVRYVIARSIPGALVECGVWRGGSVLAMIHQLQALGVTDRDIYLYDTFEGMTEPTEKDTSSYDPPALETWQHDSSHGVKSWANLFNSEIFNESDVVALIRETGYPQERLHFVKGRVEDTIPGVKPDAIAVLRLDTDWYESTRHELIHLYPLLQMGGVLIIDDYGHWDGARIAVDEYFGESPLLLHRIDYTGRSAIKI